MLLQRSASEARRNQRRIQVNGHEYVLSAYVGAAPVRGTYVDGNEVNDNALPQGFLVQQPPGSVTPPHFHEVNQFQVFVGGNGRMGKRPAGPVTVQYANGHTPYGPIVAGEQGVTYFTLRAAWDPGAKYMPKSLMIEARRDAIDWQKEFDAKNGIARGPNAYAPSSRRKHN